MGAQYTPGPWGRNGIDLVDDEGRGRFGVQLFTAAHDPISEDEMAANARLIAAAPALLEALECAFSELWDAHHSCMSEAEFDERFAQIRAAIRLAKGEQTNG